MALVVKRLTQHIAAEIRGVDLSAPVSEADFQEIQRAFDELSILVFPDLFLALNFGIFDLCYFVFF